MTRLLPVALWAVPALVLTPGPWMPAAEHPHYINEVVQGARDGDAAKQYRLGMWNFWALPQQRDEEAALFWFCESAKQGFAAAQVHLGLMYWTGNGVAEDPVQAYLWFELAAVQGSEAAAHHRARVARDRLTPHQVRAARRMADAWRRTPTCPVRLS